MLTLTPGEPVIIAADVDIGFLDRFTGAVIITGDGSSIETALKEDN